MSVPIRTCVVCGLKKPKEELIRTSVDSDGNLRMNGKGKKASRGSYICRDADCVRKARKSPRLAGKCVRPIPGSFFRELERQVSGYREPKGG